jgi:hypothetical protein
MPLQVVCPGCNAKLKAPDTAAGKKTKCPKCQAVISVPVDAPQAPAASPGVKKAENWHMQTTDGSQFGPVPKSELDEWFKEGRISADCQLLKEGADQWQWASEVYPSLEQPAPAGTPSKGAAGFDFLGPATSTNDDPLGLGNAGLTAAAQPLAPLQSLAAPGPAFPSAPSFGAANSFGGSPAPSFGGGYGGGSYGVPANPYSSPSTASYGSQYGAQRRSGLHPLVVVASIIEFFVGGLYAVGTLGFGILAIVLLIGGAAAASNLPQNNADTKEATAVIAAFSGMGALCMIPFLLLFLCLSGLMIYTGVGLLKKRFWAKIVAIIMGILHVLPQLLVLFISIISLEPCNLLTALVGVALHTTVLVAMFIPDCTSDFS